MTYAHRNGETEPPTVAGRYWFSGAISGWSTSEMTLVTLDCAMAWNNRADVESFVDIAEFVGQWWGPVLAPWESGK